MHGDYKMHKHVHTTANEKRPCEWESRGWKGGEDEDEGKATWSRFEALIIMFTGIESAVLCFFSE